MREGYFKFARQVSGRGAFAAVRLAVETTEPPTNIGVVESEQLARRYISAAKTEVELGYEQLWLEGQNPPTVNVTILEIVATYVDTLAIFVVYASCNAFCDALGMSLQRPIEIDFREGRISFPVGRA